ncbi:MAG: aminodeoxychorismate synthase component I [Bergeyella sp.]|nr:aminodeoxychorismate synthase component I [Bergeyella sp.]
MDLWSSKGLPFLFIIDFLAEKIEFYSQKQIVEKGILVNFEHLKTYPPRKNIHKTMDWETFPEQIEAYSKGFNVIQNHLKKGNSYLVNYTQKTEIKTNLNLEEIFYSSYAKYKILYPERWVCFSPETFIKIRDSEISAFPMKGTIEASIKNAKNLLVENPKEKAEHYTVVDLLRNDLSRVARKVRVKKFQNIDLIKTSQKNLYAMSSEITGTLRSNYRGKIGSTLREMLPAGSILGAPKEKTLEIVKEAEEEPRGFYTGVAGWYDGKNLDSCVLIRFLEKERNKIFFRSGGGITHQSLLKDEYEEMKNKIYVPIAGEH